jgi:hypothetical protein
MLSSASGMIHGYLPDLVRQLEENDIILHFSVSLKVHIII